MTGVARSGRRLAVIAVATGVGVLGIAGAASAHVRVTGEDATQGGYGVLTFRVPTESATASTTRIRVSFPARTPITSVSTQPMPGWTARVHTKRLAEPVTTDDGPITTYVASVDWRADSAKDAIAPGQFQMFNVSAGPLPKVSTVSFPTRQTYSDGSTVDWDQIAIGDAEPEHPAPTLTLGPDAATGATAGTTGETTEDTGLTAAGAATWPGITGLVAGVLGLVTGGLALVQTRQMRTDRD